MSYRFVPHTADVKVEIRAATVAELLGDCVAVVRELVAGSSPVDELLHHPVRLREKDPARRVWTFVRLLLDRFNVDAFIPARVEILEEKTGWLSAVVHGEPAQADRHEPQPEVKALTHHGFSVTRRESTWEVELLFDV